MQEEQAKKKTSTQDADKDAELRPNEDIYELSVPVEAKGALLTS